MHKHTHQHNVSQVSKVIGAVKDTILTKSLDKELAL